MSMSQNKIYKFYLFLPILIILLPLFPTFFSINLGAQIIFAFEISMVIGLGIIGLYKFEFTLIAKAYCLLFLLITMISLFCDIFNEYIVIKDTFEIIKPIAFLLFYTFYRKSNLRIERLEIATLHSIIFVFIVLAIYSIIEYLLPDIITPISLLLYKRDTLLVLEGKAIGSFSQTYDFAYILILPIMYFFISLLRHFTLKYFLFFLALFFAFLLTQSRSMYISLVICLFLIYCLPYFHRNIASSIKITGIVIVIIFIIAYIYIVYQDNLRHMFPYAFYGFESIWEGESNSVNTRREQIEWALANNHLVLIGGGISKDLKMLESFYSLYYYRYGIIGVCIYLIIPIITAYAAYQISKKEYNNKKLSSFYLSLCVFYLVTPIALSSSCHQDTPKISFLFYGLIGLVYNKYFTLKATMIKKSIK